MADHRLPNGRQTLKTHDIRHLCLCGICGGIADKRTSVSYSAAYSCQSAPETKDPDAFWHPSCCYDKFGESFVLELPDSERKKFCLSDIPIWVMKKLVERAYD